MEDTVTYVTEPSRLAVHREALDRLRELGPQRILPNHGEPALIATGGYPIGLIDATQQYIDALSRLADEPALEATPLRELVAGPLAEGWITWFEPYEAVHRENVELVLGRATPGLPGPHSAAAELVLHCWEPRRARRVGERVARRPRRSSTAPSPARRSRAACG